MDASRLNAVASHPEVRPHIGLASEGPLDFSATLANPNIVCLEVEHGAFVFDQHDPQQHQGRFELHTFLLPEGRGDGVLPAAAAAFRWMFTRTDCLELLTKVPATNKPAALMARRAGFVPIFKRVAAWEDGSDIDYFSMTLDAWRARDAEVLAEGQAFHAQLEAAKAAAGAEAPAHPDDEAHDRAVGAACLMAKAGNPAKACWTYNAWARFAGYQTAELLKAAPPVINVRDAVVTFTNNEMEILRCPAQL